MFVAEVKVGICTEVVMSIGVQSTKKPPVKRGARPARQADLDKGKLHYRVLR